MTTNDMPAKNTDRELWRESDDRSQCTPSIHVTQDGGIGISVGGTVITRTLREWHELANGPRIPFIAPNGMTSPVAADVAKIACATPIIAKPEQPPFALKQFVRIKSSGTILNVARCEKRVVHGALRWVVDDLNGMRAFAADCELVKNMELVNAETGEAVIHLKPPPVRYACTKVAAAGHTVKIWAPSDGRLCRVLAINDPKLLLRPLNGDGDVELLAEFVEFVPEVTVAHPACRGCCKPLSSENALLCDGCPCNSPRGINHGLVPTHICTCDQCDQQQTGGTRKPAECAAADHIADAGKMVEAATTTKWPRYNRGYPRRAEYRTNGALHYVVEQSAPGEKWRLINRVSPIPMIGNGPSGPWWLCHDGENLIRSGEWIEVETGAEGNALPASPATVAASGVERFECCAKTEHGDHKIWNDADKPVMITWQMVTAADHDSIVAQEQHQRDVYQAECGRLTKLLAERDSTIAQITHHRDDAFTLGVKHQKRAEAAEAELAKLKAEPSITTEFDFDAAVNKAAAVILEDLDDETTITKADWISDAISAQIRPGVQQLYAKLQHRRCDTCGANTIDGCTRCGAPQCCPQCCKIDEYERDRATSNEHHLMALMLLGQFDNRMFLVGDFEVRKAAGGWKLFRPPYGALVGNDLKAQVFADPVQAALRAKELADVR